MKIVIQVRFSLHPVEVNSCFADLPNVFAPHPKTPFINSTDVSEFSDFQVHHNIVDDLSKTCLKSSNGKVP